MYDYQHKPALQKKASAPSAADRSRAPAAQPARAPAWANALPIQAKLTVNRPGDIYEQEADAVAERVMRMPEPRVQRKCACGGDAGPDGECEACKARRLGLQRKADGASAGEAPASVHDTLSRPGQPLDAGMRTFMEPRFGEDFSAVRIHTDTQATRSAADVSAKAYTVGNNIVFGADHYSPSSSEGQRLIAHELAHTLQQGTWGARLMLQRTCDHTESYYQAAPNFCLDTDFSPSTHLGKRCYREIVPRRWWQLATCPPGQHVCFNNEGECVDSPDQKSLADSKKSDGSCGWRWGCVAQHTLVDFLPSVLQLDCLQACKNVPDPRCMSQCISSK